jgi:hypothetical protein
MAELTEEKVLQAVNAILEGLGTPSTELHQEALEAFQNGDADALRLLAATNLGDHYLRSLGYLVSAKTKVMPTTPVVLAEAARAAADYSRERTMETLGAAIKNAIGQGEH